MFRGACLWGLGEGAVPKLSHESPGSSSRSWGWQAPYLTNLHATDRSPSLPSSNLYPDPSPFAAPPTPTLSSSLGKSPPSLRPSRFPMKSPQVMRFPMF